MKDAAVCDHLLCMQETVEAENIEQQARKLEREHEISRLQQEADKASEQLHFENVSAAIASRIDAWQEEINDGNLAVSLPSCAFCASRLAHMSLSSTAVPISSITHGTSYHQGWVPCPEQQQ